MVGYYLCMEWRRNDHDVCWSIDNTFELFQCFRWELPEIKSIEMLDEDMRCSHSKVVISLFFRRVAIMVDGSRMKSRMNQNRIIGVAN